MKADLSHYRKVYDKRDLLEREVSDNPMQLFQTWFYEVEAVGGVEEANAMTLSTIGLDGFPKSRVVLLKRYTYEGFIFFTNYESEKGVAITHCPRVCLSFFWPNLERQVIVKGLAEKLSSNLSDGYFDSRPLGSRIGAVISPQSRVVPGREFLQQKYQEMERQVIDNKNIINRPEYWGGYLVRPQSMEFWQGRPNRLHDRLRFVLTEQFDWKIERLAP